MIAKMSVKRICAAAAVLMLAGAVGASWAQRKMSPGSNLCVSKNSDDAEGSCYTTVQAAVNAAKKGQVIEILDESTYREQVTIDGRATSPWTGVTGGKDGITLRYVPAGGAGAAWNHARPTILYRDITNTHPKNSSEAKQLSEVTGAVNFETCGALRVLRAKGVTIEGIAVDGGGPFAFGQNSTWCNAQGGDCSPLFHGNAAITLAVAGQVTIRDCDLKNAYFGINVKDRNTGGVFGNPNKADQDSTIPLSNFGMVGGHLFEYNKINTNVVGVFFESAWDFGSTVRYNLIYGNKIANQPNIASLPEPNNQNAGAFMFKDMYLSPVAIYNNTLYDNSGNFCGHWQAGGQHLIFNNIFSKSRPSENKGYDHMSLDGKFPFRMYHCVFSTDSSYLQLRQQNNYCSSNPETPGGRFVVDLRFQGTGFASPTSTTVNVATCKAEDTPLGQTQGQRMVLPGAKIPGLGEQMVTAADSFFSDANIRWLQTEGLGGAWSELLPSLFKSLSPASPDFLVPDWEKKAVQDFIKNKGWPAAGIRNNDGSIADLGAIPSTGVRQTTVARILPNSVVLLSANGANATANFRLNENRGTLISPKIKSLRWIAPIPTNTLENAGVASPTDPTGGNWPSRIRPVARDAVTPVTNTSALMVGNNSFSFTTGKTSVPRYGFFEIIAEGTDASGNTVASDVGFLPYRNLDYIFELVVTAPNGTSALKTLVAGEPYKLTVTAKKVGESGNYTGVIPEVTYSLLSDPTAFMYYASGANRDNALTIDKNKSYPQSYEIYFTRATNAETIFAAGAITLSGQMNGAPINGILDLTVRPGKAEKAVFTDPISLKQLGNATAPAIYRGVEQPVTVEVRDRYDNAVDETVTVNISSSDETIGVVGAPGAIATNKTAATNNKGVATFAAKAGDRAFTGATFDMTAAIAGVTQTDRDNVGRLRVGKQNDRLEVFYSDSALTAGYYGKKIYYDVDYSVIIDRDVGEWDMITVRVVNLDTVKTTGTAGKYVLVTPNVPDLIFSATPGGAAETIFPLTNGVAKFYVGAPNARADITDAGIVVTALNSRDANDRDASIMLGGREGINFRMKTASIVYAVVYGDGQGRPDSLRIFYKTGSLTLRDAGAMPSKVDLNWGGAVLSASGTSLAARGDYVLWVDFKGLPDRPTGYTSIRGFGRGLVTVYGGGGGATVVEKAFDVYDGVGPVLGNWAAGDGAGRAPFINERTDPGANDVLEITISEEIADVSKLKTILYVAGTVGITAPPMASGTSVAVISAKTSDNRTFTLTVGNAAGLKAGDWIRLDPSGNNVVTDIAATQSGGVLGNNPPHPDNRWVQLRLSEKNPEVLNAWYTGDNATGRPNFAYVVFDKKIDLTQWFTGGRVKFDDDGNTISVSAATVDELFEVIDGDGTQLKINLSKAAPKIASSGPVRTAGVMRFTLGYSASVMWDYRAQEVWAMDKAAPVLANTAVLKPGAVKNDGKSFYQDTLTVYYSEQLSAASQSVGVKNPLTIKQNDGILYEPSLTLLGSITPVTNGTGAGYYKAAYLLDQEIRIELGDSVHINPDLSAGIGDVLDPSNVQTDLANKYQPLTVMRYNVPDNPNDIQFNVTVSNNPLRRGGGDRTEIAMAFNTGGLEINASIRVYDNRGNTVLAANMYDYDVINWSWDGRDKKGRLVDVGTYRFKGVCNVTVGGRKKAYTAEKSIGVVQGGNNFGAEVIGNAPIDASSGNFTAGANPATRLSGVIGFFWDGAGIKSGTLYVYDISGNLVKKIGVVGESAGVSGKRKVGEWDLIDGRGRAVADGSYFVKGSVTAKDGKKRSVSAVIGVSK